MYFSILKVCWFHLILTNMCKTNASSSVTDNIFITRSKNYTISPHINGLSHHKAQIIAIENNSLTKQRNNITTMGTSMTKEYWNLNYY